MWYKIFSYQVREDWMIVSQRGMQTINLLIQPILRGKKRRIIYLDIQCDTFDISDIPWRKEKTQVVRPSLESPLIYTPNLYTSQEKKLRCVFYSNRFQKWYRSLTMFPKNTLRSRFEEHQCRPKEQTIPQRHIWNILYNTINIKSCSINKCSLWSMCVCSPVAA